MKTLTKFSLAIALFVSSSAAFAAPAVNTAADKLAGSKAVITMTSEAKPAQVATVDAATDANVVKQPVTCTAGVNLVFVSFEVSWCCANCD
ncbi:hypothetical protein [Spirosoma sp. KUDC1026]|uniref:hypothetical protein n=1 Tax=Spirosoma sp. KUDC1026 TaxID=2745947 RepID=UPI00159BB333|nr:hypothetical protein [Spirosoma sp. KUDC1026]QKZ11290.1 hypothetical protein HU175_01015 [Spirosoma sp. KUDC1026]